MLGWREHPAAREELVDAVDWYEDRAPDLGSRFADAVDADLRFIRRWPDIAPRYGRRRLPQIRRKGMDLSPYGIIYFVREGEVVVVA